LREEYCAKRPPVAAAIVKPKVGIFVQRLKHFVETHLALKVLAKQFFLNNLQILPEFSWIIT